MRHSTICNNGIRRRERDESATAAAAGRGGTLDIHADSGQVALQGAGLLDRFKSIARYDATVKIADGKGKVYVSVEEKDSDVAKPEIDRKDSRALLLSSISEDKVRWVFRVQRVQREANESMSVHFADGRIESEFQLVVGADGAWSKARSLVSRPHMRLRDLSLTDKCEQVTSAKPQYSGIHYLTTAIHPENPIHSSAVSLA